MVDFYVIVSFNTLFQVLMVLLSCPCTGEIINIVKVRDIGIVNTVQIVLAKK